MSIEYQLSLTAQEINNKLNAVVDQNYNPESKNAQSGKAVAEAISEINSIGHYNENKEDSLFEVGDGSVDDNDEIQKHNAFDVGKDSNGEYFITIGNTKITESQLINLLALDSEVESLLGDI